MEMDAEQKDGSGPAGQSGQHALSCTHCRQRKVKCNKTYPCLPCQRSGFECTFPERAKHPRRKRTGNKNTTQDLLDRLGRMEKLLAGADNEGKLQQSDTKMAPTPPRTTSETSTSPTPRKGSLQEIGLNDRDREGSGSPTSRGQSDGLNKFIGVSFWRTLTSEFQSLRQAIDDEEEEEGQTPSSTTTDGHHSTVMFGSAYNTPQNLRPLHPPAAHITALSEIYIHSVDPVCKILHTPTLRTLVSNVISNLDNIPSDNYVEPLLFAVYYGAITTLTNEQCLTQFQDGRESLLAKFRAGTERALANANFLCSTELGVLQALCIFVLTVRSNDGSQFAWTLFATLLRLAHSIGLHREGMSEGLSPFVREMRRRLWWQLIVLDIRGCEDRASEPLINPLTFNTRKPLNINDTDIDADMTEAPPEREGFTELTKVSVSHAVSFLRWRMGEIPQFWGQEEVQNAPTVEERMGIVDEVESTLNQRVIRFCDTSQPLPWVTSAVARLIMCRVRLTLYHPLGPASARDKKDRPQVSNEKLLETAVKCMEYSHLLDTEPKAAPWRWFFKTYVQWHGLAIALAELCIQTKGPLVDRAWRIVDTVFEDWSRRIADSPNGMLWRPVKKLMAKAQTKRLQVQQVNQQLSSSSSAQHPLPKFGSLSFEPGVIPADSVDTPTNTNTTDLKAAYPHIVPHLPPFNRNEPNVTAPSSNTVAGFNGSLEGIEASAGLTDISTSLPGGPLNDTVLTGTNFAQQTSDTGMSTESILGDVGTGEINWAEWDEFMSGFDMNADAMKDVDMYGMGIKSVDPEGKGVDVWW